MRGMTNRWRICLLLALAPVWMGCERQPASRSAAAPMPPEEAATRAPVPEPAGEGIRIVFLGDSITEGHGLDPAQAFPDVLGRMLAREGIRARIVNAGVGGDTSAGGLSRLDWLLRQNPDLLVVALGGNDGLRGLSTDMTEANLLAIVRQAADRGVRVLLLGVLMPPNYGPQYTEAFARIYPRVAAQTGAPLVPFFLDGVGGVPEMNLPDGMHPNGAGHARIAENVLESVKALLDP